LLRAAANVPAKLSHYSCADARGELGLFSSFSATRNRVWLLPGLSPSSSLPHTLLAQRPSESWGSTPAGQHVPLQRKTMSFFFFPMANKGFGDKIWGNGDSWRFPACYRSCLGTRVCARGPIPSPSPGQRQWRGGWSQMPVSNKAQLPP